MCPKTEGSNTSYLLWLCQKPKILTVWKRVPAAPQINRKQLDAVPDAEKKHQSPICGHRVLQFGIRFKFYVL